jgi:osmotically-inducible protein OsmY
MDGVELVPDASSHVDVQERTIRAMHGSHAMQLLFKFRCEHAAGDLEHAVRLALNRAPHLEESEASEILVKVYGGDVILAGIVSTDQVRDLALHVAARVPGVQRVLSKLRTDSELTRALRSRLCSNPITVIARIEACVFHGVAELRGSAPYDAQLAAIKMARAIGGIRNVVNHLQLSADVGASA